MIVSGFLIYPLHQIILSKEEVVAGRYFFSRNCLCEIGVSLVVFNIIILVISSPI